MLPLDKLGRGLWGAPPQSPGSPPTGRVPQQQVQMQRRHGPRDECSICTWLQRDWTKCPQAMKVGPQGHLQTLPAMVPHTSCLAQAPPKPLPPRPICDPTLVCNGLEGQTQKGHREWLGFPGGCRA